MAKGIPQMNAGPGSTSDPRVNQIVDLIVQFAQGNLEARADASESGDDLDGIITGLNMLGEELEDSFKALAQTLAELRGTQKQLIQQERLSALGEMAAGVAHDFNNALTTVMMCSRLGQLELPPEDPLSDYFEEIQQASERSADLIRQLLLFSRHQITEPKALSLNELILDIDTMLRRLIGENIELVVLPGSDSGSVKADRSQIEQLLVNLVINARDAMPEGGKLIIRTSGTLVDGESDRQGTGLRSGEYVMLEVSDTGTGMTEDVRSRIFEPFFTTKEVGKGVGLGLSTCYGIVEQSGGHIFVSGVPGQGAKFEVFLPAVEEPATAPARADHIKSSPRGSETLLLIEDESSVRTAIASLLRNHGYTVLEAGNGEEALRVVDNSDGSIDLLLTDVVMPLMSGGELVNRLDVEHPGMRVLYMSGYGNAITHESDGGLGRVHSKTLHARGADAPGTRCPGQPGGSHR